MIASWKKRAANWPLRRKALVLVICSSALLVLLVAVICMNVVVRANEELLSQSMGNTLSFSASSITGRLNDASAVANSLYAEDTVQTQLAVVRSPGMDYMRSTAYNKLYNVVQTYYWKYRSDLNLRYISLRNDSFATNSDEGAVLRTPDALRQQLLREAEEADGALVIHTADTAEEGLFLTRTVRQIAGFTLKPLGTLTLCIDLGALVRKATDFSSAYGQTYFILSDGEHTLYQSEELDEATVQTLRAESNGEYAVAQCGDRRYFIVRGALEGYGWEYLCAVSYDDTYRSIQLSYWLFVALALAAMGVTLLLSSRMIASVSKHFDALVVKMRSFRGKSAALVPAYDYSQRTDEIGVMHTQFDAMAREIETLIERNYVQELLAKDAQLQALETQINPHFLYNVLESVNWRARAAGAKDISQIVDALGKLLRVSLDKRRKLISLREELDLVGYYVTIQQLRYEDRLRYHQRVDETLLGAAIPKLVIQPLVENAVRYAVETSIDEACDIEVSVARSGGDLTIEVRNSGSAFEEDLLPKLRREEIKPHGFGIGLLNIDDRLRLTFGEGYGLTLYSEEDHAAACIRIPYQHIGEVKNA